MPIGIDPTQLAAVLGPLASQNGAPFSPFPGVAPQLSTVAADAGFAPQAANAAAEAGGRAAGFLAKTPWANVAEGSGGSGILAAGRALGPGSIGRAGAYGIAGQLGSGLIRSAIGGEKDGSWDNALESAASFGGAGAGLGSMIAPGIGTVIGGGVGAAVGGLWGWTHGSDSDSTNVRKEVGKQEKALAPFLNKLSPEARDQITTQLGIAAQQFTKPADVKAAYGQIAQGVPQVLAQEQQQRQQMNNLLAMQSIIGPQFDTFLKGLGADQHAYADAQTQFANSISGSPAIGNAVKANAQQSVMSNDATAAAYKAQMNSQYQQLAGQIGAPQSIVDQLRRQYG